MYDKRIEDFMVRLAVIAGFGIGLVVSILAFIFFSGCSTIESDREGILYFEKQTAQQVDYSKGEWTLVVIPDTQHYSQDRKRAPLWKMQRAFQWIVDNRDALNIRMVQGLGDITEGWDRHWEWENAYWAWNLLDGHVLHVPARGNHDSPQKLNEYFPCERYKGLKWFGHCFKGIQNSYFTMRNGADDYLFMTLDSFDPYSNHDWEAIDWAKNILYRHPDKKVILATHDTWISKVVRQQLLDKFDNIVMSNAGHSCVREAYFKTRNSHNFVTDYQCDHDEIMLIRYYVFKPQEDAVYFYTYSPANDWHETDSNSQGVFHLPQADLR